MAAISEGCGILVVEDNAEELRVLSGALRERNFTVLTAGRGSRALDLLESRAGTGVRVVLLDLIMPDIHGMELAERMNLLRPDLKILIISGYADGVVLQGALDAGNVGFMSKPFKINDLCAKLRVLLR